MALQQQYTTIPPPHRLLIPLNVSEKKLFGPGPSNMPGLVKHGLAQPLLGHLHPEFLEIMDDVRAGLKYLFQTNNALTFAVSGTGHAGMECAIMNLLEPGETLLVLQNGIWGHRAAEVGRRLGLNVQKIVVPEGEVIQLNDFVKAVKEHKPAVAFLCHGESSTGVVHPIEGFGDVCLENNCLLLVDTVASVGGAPFHADELKVDCVYAATQKVLNVPPGLAPISFSDRAMAKIRYRKTPVQSWYFDALELGNYWGCFDEPRRYHHTAPIPLVYALREGLSAVVQEGLENVVGRHQHNAHYFYNSLAEIGLGLFVENANHRLPCLTTVKVPEGVDWKAVQAKLMARGIEIAGGLGPTAGKIWRIGTFGINSNTDEIDVLTNTLKSVLYEQQDQEGHRKAAI
jgi:alanine-glyoxylate transaminase/serine-glyoxylate transaminase/serine-pyruvate transaminase